MVNFSGMIILGFLFPLVSILLIRPRLRWQVLRLFASSVAIYTIIHWPLQSIVGSLSIKYIFYFVVAFCETSNLEHVINNNSNQNFVFLKFLLDPVFLKGSGLTKRFFLRLGCIFLLVSLVAYFEVSIPSNLLTIMFFLSALISFLIKPTSLVPDWTQEHWIIHNLRVIFKIKDLAQSNHLRKDVKFDYEKLNFANKAYAELRPQELSAEKWLNNKKKINVLVIVLEGVGEIHFRKGWLPKLFERRNKNIHVKTFISHQRNTNRGLYSLFSGMHPNLKELMAKPDLVAQYGKMDVGLGEVMKRNDYETCFVQGAPSVFMCKDRFMPALGFDQIIGEEKFPKDWPRIKWGVDDQQLYKMALLKIDELNSSDRPWLLGTLSVSAHHPFQASNKNLKNIEDAIRYADEELEEFLLELERRKVLEKTLVFITSDEAATDGSHILAESLGCMMVQHPENIQKQIETPLAQSDLAISICDYLDLKDNPFLGRSIFRDYKQHRPLFFSSLFQQKVFKFQGSTLSILHYSGKSEKFELEKLDLDSNPRPSKPELDKDIIEFLEASDRGLSFLTKPVIMDVPELNPTGEESVKSPGFIKVGIKKDKTVKVEFNAQNQSDSLPLIVNWLIQDMKHKRSFKLNLVVLPKSNGKFEKEFKSPDDSWYDLSIKVIAKGNVDWFVKDLQIYPVD